MIEKLEANNELFETAFNLGISGKSGEFSTYLSGYETKILNLTTQRENSVSKSKELITHTCSTFKNLLTELENTITEFERKRIIFIKEVQTEWGLLKNLDGIDNNYIQKVHSKSLGMLEKYESAIEKTMERLNQELHQLNVQDTANQLKEDIIQNYDNELIKLEENKEYLKSGFYKGFSLRSQIEEIDTQQKRSSNIADPKNKNQQGPANSKK